ncbi:MAG: Acg family FMN-binding oxidoreductase [Mycobacterium sp.]
MTTSTIDRQVLADVVGLACRAPSVHNSQPWRLVATGGALRLFLAPHRVPRATDPSGREAMMSCGALLDHIQVAAAAAGWTADIARFPNPNELDHLATVEFRPLEFVTTAHRARAEAIAHRRTDRLPFAAPPAWDAFEPMLRATVDPDKAALHVLDDAARPRLADASRLTETLRRYDASYHAELLWWTADFEASDSRVDIARALPAVQHPERRPEVSVDRSAIVVLSTRSGSRREMLGCGEVLSDVLLEATMAGLATCTLTHITELEASRSILRTLTGDTGDPQLLIRIGLVPEGSDQPPMTGRRPTTDVLEFED